MRVSRYQQNDEQSAELLRLILPQIGRHGSNFNPCSYALWYEHLAGINASLSLAIQSRLRGGAAMSTSEVLNFYEQHVQSHEVGTLLQLQAGLGDLLRKLGEIAAESGAETNKYYEVLLAHQEQLSHVVEPQTLRDLLEGLKDSTQTVRLQTARLHIEIESGREQINNLREQLSALQEEAATDPLTGLKNRRGFERACEQMKESESHEGALLLLDVDRFKEVNDKYGHLFGDQVLRAVAQVISASVKGQDLSGRFGGDEFVILLPETSAQGAHVVAERIRAAFGRARIRRGGSDICVEQLSLSIGVAVGQCPDLLQTLLNLADQALYEAKSAGRNRVCFAADR